MKTQLAAFASGLLFSVGLVVSGMVRPAKIIGFLDFTGAWDPALALVMAAGVAVMAVAFRLAPRVPPLRTGIDASLVGGAVLFGLGWGIAGYCPGPAVVAFATLQKNALWFLPGMLAGMAILSAATALGRRGFSDETGAPTLER